LKINGKKVCDATVVLCPWSVGDEAVCVREDMAIMLWQAAMAVLKSPVKKMATQ
jgi:hypothetical protein